MTDRDRKRLVDSSAGWDWETQAQPLFALIYACLSTFDTRPSSRRVLSALCEIAGADGVPCSVPPTAGPALHSCEICGMTTDPVNTAVVCGGDREERVVNGCVDSNASNAVDNATSHTFCSACVSNYVSKVLHERTEQEEQGDSGPHDGHDDIACPVGGCCAVLTHTSLSDNLEPSALARYRVRADAAVRVDAGSSNGELSMC